MRYSLEKIFHNLYYNRWIYLVIMINFMLGAGLFILCMNFEMTSRELLQESKHQSTEEIIPVIQWLVSRGDDTTEEYPISYDTYLRLENNKIFAHDLEILFSMNYFEHIVIYEPEQLFESQVYFMNENMFSYLYGFSRNTGVVYLGNTAYQNLLSVGAEVKSGDENNIAFVESKIYIEGDLLVKDGKSYPYKITMPVDTNTIMPGFIGDSGYNMAEAIIFPIEYVSIPVSPFPDTSVFLKSTMFFRYINEEWKEDIVSKLLHELNSTENRIIFEVNNTYLDLKSEMDDYSYDMDRWLLVAISVLFLSGIGCIGLMYLLLDKRRQFIAVSIAFGSTLKRIIVETTLELFLVLGLGGILGIIISPMLQQLIIYKGELQCNTDGIYIVIITAILFSVISVLLGMHEIKVKDVTKTLKE